MPLSRIFNAANMTFNAIRGSEILAKISGFTGHSLARTIVVFKITSPTKLRASESLVFLEEHARSCGI